MSSKDIYSSTGYSVAGLAWLGTVCSSIYKYSVNELQSVSTTAFVSQASSNFQIFSDENSLQQSNVDCRPRNRTQVNSPFLHFGQKETFLIILTCSSLGAEHDGTGASASCPSDSYIMGPSGGTNLLFSNCSMQAFLNQSLTVR